MREIFSTRDGTKHINLEDVAYVEKRPSWQDKDREEYTIYLSVQIAEKRNFVTLDQDDGRAFMKVWTHPLFVVVPTKLED